MSVAREIQVDLNRVAPWMQPFIDAGQMAIVLDGGTGTTLVDRGADVSSMFWSAQMFLDSKSPVTKDELYQLHYDFLEAGADVILTNCYKLSDELLSHIPEDSDITVKEAHGLILEACDIACRARDAFQATLSDNAPHRLVCCCFGGFGASIPQQVCPGLSFKGYATYPVTDEHLTEFWRGRLHSALESSADLIGMETVPDLRETKLICEVLNEIKPTKPVWIAWSCRNGTQISDGNLISDAVKIVDACEYVTTVGINCTDSLHIDTILTTIATHTKKSMIAYPNFGRKWDARMGHRCWVGDKHQYHTEVAKWAQMGAKLIGGCCECDPTYLNLISRALKKSASRRTNRKRPAKEAGLSSGDDVNSAKRPKLDK